jgi:hypothetical protein
LGVKDGTRDPATGLLVHDDFILADSLTAELDRLEWAISSPSLIVPAPDPLTDMDRKGNF